MATQELRATKRTETGKAAAKRLRRQGLVPAVAYGLGEEPRLLTLDNREVRHHLARHGASGLVTLRIEGENDVPTIIKEIQTHPASHELSTVDFLRVSLSEEVQAVVPLVLEGDPIGVTQDGGILVQAAHTLEVSALPQNLPEHITLDVSSLEMNGPALTVADLQLPDGVTVITDAEEALAIVNAPRVAAETETEAEAGAEGEAAAEEAPAENSES